MLILVIVLISYLLGSVPVGFIVGKTKGIDIRKHGSGNIGTTNAFRVMGKAGIIVLAGDVAKGILAVLLGKYFGGPVVGLISGLAAMAGHNWSIFLKFNGGRGVATAAGVLIALAPPVMVLALSIWGITVFITRYVSLGSILGAGPVPILLWAFDKHWSYIIFGVVVAVLIIYRHCPNLKRLLDGTEYKWGEKAG